MKRLCHHVNPLNRGMTCTKPKGHTDRWHRMGYASVIWSNHDYVAPDLRVVES